MTEIDVARVRAETPGIVESAHLLACGSALMPAPVVDAVIEHTRLEALQGGYEAQALRAAELDAVYDQVAAHLGAERREIALMENATVAWAHAFYALPFKPGARILTAEAEYAANYVAFLQRARREDLKIEVVPSDGSGALDLEALERMMDDDVGLIAVTWVPTNGGLVNPAAEIGRIARAHGAPYLLDACQAVGQMPVDVAALGCDFLSATGRKFLRGPRGTGFLYVRGAWLDRLEPAMIDHFGAPWVARDAYTLREDARRFETWENAYALRAGLGAAITYAEAIGMEAIERRVRALADRCRERLAAVARVELRDLGAAPSGIVSFTIDDAEPRAVVAEMAASGFAIGASIPSSTRIDSERRGLPAMLRIAPHYYNTEDEIDRAVERLGAIARR
ncbi:MAG: aminotransferase class V-fold PLP-dependent enzyme [Pseudomonadota bacterium]